VRLGAHLAVFAYFFLLRVGEYTHTRPRKDRKRLTVPLRKKDLRAWTTDGTATEKLLSNDASLGDLHQMDGITIDIENQKNGKKGASLHQERASDPTFSPTYSAALILHAMRGMPEDTPIGSFWEAGARAQVTDDDLRTIVRQGAVGDNLESHGFSLDRIGTISLRAGGATRLKLAGYDSDMIQLIGRWSSRTYQTYIRTQIAQLTAGVSTAMAKDLRYTVVGSRVRTHDT
jgi:hypothetical protein